MLHARSRVGARQVLTWCAPSAELARQVATSRTPSLARTCPMTRHYPTSEPASGSSPETQRETQSRVSDCPRPLPLWASWRGHAAQTRGRSPESSASDALSAPSASTLTDCNMVSRVECTMNPNSGCLQVHSKLTAFTALTTNTRSCNNTTATTARAALCLLHCPFQLLPPLVPRLFPPLLATRSAFKVSCASSLSFFSTSS